MSRDILCGSENFMKMIQTPICSLHILLKKTHSFLEHPTWMSHEVRIKGDRISGL